jgi:hypothetical protein
MIRQSRRDLPKDNSNSLVLEVLRYDWKKEKMRMEKEGVEELKRKLMKKGEKK